MHQSIKLKGWFICVLLVTYLVNTPGLVDETLVGRFVWLTFTGLFGITILLKKFEAIRINCLDLILIALYLLSAGSLFWSKVPSAGLIPTQTILIMVLTYFCFRSFLEKIPERFLSKVISILTVIVLAFTLYQIVLLGMAGGIGGEAIYEVAALSGHKNILAAYLLMLFGINLWLMPSDKSRKWIFLLLAVQVIVIFLLRSRTTLLALILFLFLIVFYYLIHDFRKWKIMVSRVIPITLGVALVSILIFSRLGGSSEELNRFNPANFMKDASMAERLFVWYKTTNLIQDQWLMGYGAGNWKIVFPSKGISGGYRLESKDVMFTRVHNDFLEMWAEQGILGFILFTGVFLTGMAALVIQLRKSKKPDIRLVILLGLLISYVVISFFDFPKERLELQLMLALILALIAHSCPSFFNHPKFSWNLSKVATHRLLVSAGMLLLLNLPVGYFQVRGEVHTLNAMKAQISGHWPVAESESRKAYSPFYQITPMAIAVKWYEGLALYHRGNYPGAREAFEIAIKHTPYFVRLLNDFASCLVQLNDFEGARDLYLRVMFINPKFEDGMFNLAYIYAQTGDFENAYTWLNRTTSNPAKKEEFTREIKVLESASK